MLIPLGYIIKLTIAFLSFPILVESGAFPTDADAICKMHLSTATYHPVRITYEILNSDLLSAQESSFIETLVIPHLQQFAYQGLQTRTAPVDYRHTKGYKKHICGPDSTELGISWNRIHHPCK
jgi:hypothetical protein